MYNNYPNYYQNPYVQQRPIQQIQPMQPMAMQNDRPMLNGKSVDSIDVVKAMDIPLDGSVSYFPLTDGSAIITKKLQNDGTSKTTIYKPIEEEKVEQVHYATLDDITKAIGEIDLSDIDDLKDEIKELRQELKDLKKKKSD